MERAFAGFRLKRNRRVERVVPAKNDLVVAAFLLDCRALEALTHDSLAQGLPGSCRRDAPENELGPGVVGRDPVSALLLDGTSWVARRQSGSRKRRTGDRERRGSRDEQSSAGH